MATFQHEEPGAHHPRASAGGGAPADSPRPVIRGESFDAIGIDWLAWSVRGMPVQEAVALVADWIGTDARVLPATRGGFGFQSLAPLIAHGISHDYPIGIVAWGGASQRDTTHVSISATGTALIDDWGQVAADLVMSECYITRCDIAADDMKGTNSVDHAVDLYRSGGFSAGGRSPDCVTTGDWLGVTGKGRTLYVGKRANGKLLRVYEKGRELGDRVNPDWARWELQLNRKDRHIPPDVLLNPLQYFAGAYRCLKDLSADGGKRIQVQKRIAERSEERLVDCCRQSFGKLIDYLLKATGGNYAEVVDMLRRPGIPSRLYLPAYGRDAARGSIEK